MPKTTLTLLLLILALWLPASQTVIIGAGGDLQAALDAALPGDTIDLLAGAAFPGNFRLPAKTSDRTEFITLRSSALAKLLTGVRVTPLSADRMPRLVTMNSGPALVAEQGSHNWRVQGLEVTTGPGVYAYDVILIGSVDATSAAVQPREIELDRLYVHGQVGEGSKRGIFFNSNAVKLTNSYISDFKSEFQDAMAVAVCNGPGPYTISNNYLEGAGYSIIFGGCQNAIVGVVPSDITFTRNHLFKPLSWKTDKWVIKNLFEMKMGRRIRVEGNVFENNWIAGQSGFGILFTVRANGVDAAGKPFSLIEDVTFANNKVINTAHGINILGQDDYVQNAGQGRRLTFRNNLFIEVPGRLFQVTQNPQDVVIEKNTALSQDFIIVSENVTTGFVMRDNLFALGTYGIFGSGLGSGNNVLKTNFPGAIVSFNGFLGDTGGSGYPANNTLLNVDARVSNFRLQADSPFRGKGQNGADPGVDMNVLEAAIAGGTVLPPARDKTGAIATLQTDGRWSLSAGNPIVRSSVKLYRNGLRQTAEIDYILDPANPHFFRPVGAPWSADDLVVADYLY
jgi:hypothetical protein